MSMMSYMGEKINAIFEKAKEETSLLKASIMSFIGGAIDGYMTFWSIFGIVYLAYMPLIWISKKLTKSEK